MIWESHGETRRLSSSVMHGVCLVAAVGGEIFLIHALSTGTVMRNLVSLPGVEVTLMLPP